MGNSVDALEEGSLKGHRKQKVLYYKLPKFFRAFAIFIYRYIFQLGFLDGKEGFIYHVTRRFLVSFFSRC